jgi:heterodisulfide reductase subunit A
MVEHKLPGARVHHLYKEMVVAGKDGYRMLQHARENPRASFLRYGNAADMGIAMTAGEGEAAYRISYTDGEGKPGSVAADLVVLCPAVVGAIDSPQVAAITELQCNAAGFFEELNSKLHAAQSKVKGIYLAGTCQAPMDIREATAQGMAAAGYVLSGLVEGKKLVVEPITACIDEERCSGCRLCGSVCPYKAISYLPESRQSSINALLCHGCGTCVAACPVGAINGNHFTNEQIAAEIEAILQ